MTWDIIVPFVGLKYFRGQKTDYLLSKWNIEKVKSKYFWHKLLTADVLCHDLYHILFVDVVGQK